MTSAKRPNRRKLLLFGSIGVVLAAAAGVTWYFKRDVPIVVQTGAIKRRSLTELVVANGRVYPVVQVVINPEVSGEIIELPVREGQHVKRGDLLVRIKPDNYVANLNSAEASYKSSLAQRQVAQAELEKADAEFKRHETLVAAELISPSVFLDVKTAFDVAKLRHENAVHQTDMAKAARARAAEDLAKTTIAAPMDGTVTRLRSQKGERVVGTAMMAGTEIMTIANLEDMEARVDVGEMDVVLIRVGQKARLEVEAFRDRKFTGVVTEIANASKGLPSGATSGGGAFGGGGGPQAEATRFEVKLGIREKELFRPGMSVTAEIETRHRTNVVTAPIASVTTRLPLDPTRAKKGGSRTKTPEPTLTASAANTAEVGSDAATNGVSGARSGKQGSKPIEVVFVLKDGRARMLPVKTGISDDEWFEVAEGLEEGQEVITGPYKAINRELEDGKRLRVGPPPADKTRRAEPR
jgi:HlyD family secretion protein